MSNFVRSNDREQAARLSGRCRILHEDMGIAVSLEMGKGHNYQSLVYGLERRRSCRQVGTPWWRSERQYDIRLPSWMEAQPNVSIEHFMEPRARGRLA